MFDDFASFRKSLQEALVERVRFIIKLVNGTVQIGRLLLFPPLLHAFVTLSPRPIPSKAMTQKNEERFSSNIVCGHCGAIPLRFRHASSKPTPLLHH